MGSGKSLLGKKLAALFTMHFTDLDHYIEAGENRSIAAIFEQEGEAGFREVETRYLSRLLKMQEPTVIALGGGTVCFNNNLQAIQHAGLLVYIELSAAALTDRLKKSRQPRPLLRGLNEEGMTEKIRELLEQRKIFYGQAHITVNGLNLTPQLLGRQIVEFRKAHSSD